MFGSKVAVKYETEVHSQIRYVRQLYLFMDNFSTC